MKKSEKTVKVYDGTQEFNAHMRELTSEATRMNAIKAELEEAFQDTGIIIDVQTFEQGWANIQSQLDAYIKAQPRPLQDSAKGYLYAQLNKMQGKYPSLAIGLFKQAPEGLMFKAEQITLIEGKFVVIEPSQGLFDILLPESKYKALETYITAFNGLYDEFGKKTALGIVNNGIYDISIRDGLGIIIREKMDITGIGFLAKSLNL